VEIKDISLPEGMRRSMSRQAEAERDRRARVINADGELQASNKLSQAAAAMSDTPGALQLRLLQTVTDVAAEKNSTLVMPFPVELLRFFEHMSGGAEAGASTAAAASPAPVDRAAADTEADDVAAVPRATDTADPPGNGVAGLPGSATDMSVLDEADPASFGTATRADRGDPA
jgi:regulator of protease activity HflC (stomatin/prohibitin superfamily)